MVDKNVVVTLHSEIRNSSDDNKNKKRIMKKFIFSMITIMVFGTTTSFGRSNSPIIIKEKPHMEAVMYHGNDKDVKHNEKKAEKSWRHKRHHKKNKTSGLPIKKREVTVSKQTLRF